MKSITNEKPAMGSVETAIRKHPFLQDLSPHQYRVLSDCASEVNFEAGEIIFRQGDPANRFYLIRKGKVGLQTWLRDRGTVTIETIGEGDVLGWSWLIPPHYWQFGARALEPVEAIFIYGTPLREECEDDHELGYALLKRVTAVMFDRLRATRKQLVGTPDTWIMNSSDRYIPITASH